MGNEFLMNLKAVTNITETENGAIAHRTTNSALVDLFATIGAYRNRNAQDIYQNFDKAFAEDKLLAMKMLFYVRDIRGGQGERRTFRIILKQLSITYPEIVIKNLHLIPEYGRWDDLICLLESRIRKDVVTFIKKQLKEDLSAEYPSLMAKWLPSENTGCTNSNVTKRIMRKIESSNDPVEIASLGLKLNDAKSHKIQSKSSIIATALISDLGMTPKQYRKTLSKIRAKLKLVEQKMCSGDWINIDYSKLPSKAGLLYREAFMRHDESGYTDYLEALKAGAKVNSKTLFPYELVGKVYKSENREYDALYNAMWEQLPNYLEDNADDAIAVVDVSDSMTWEQDALALKTAISVGLYLAERNKGPYKNHFITFNTTPALVHIQGSSFTEKVRDIRRSRVGGSTNIEAVFDLIRITAINNGLTSDDIPKRLIIISDMEFNEATCGGTYWFKMNPMRKLNTQTLFQKIKAKYDESGLDMPKLIFWNVNARNDQFPMTIDDAGVQFVSGCNPSIFKNIMGNGELLTGYDLMLEVLNHDRYKNIMA